MQQELGEIAEGDGVFAGDAALRHEEEGMGDGAVDVGGGGEIAAERFECGRLKSRATCTDGQLLLSRRAGRKVVRLDCGSAARRKKCTRNGTGQMLSWMGDAPKGRLGDPATASEGSLAHVGLF